MMKAIVGDSVVDDDRDIGIIESRDRNLMTIRYPARGNHRYKKTRDQVEHLAERIRQARVEGKPLQVGSNISLTGESTLAELVGLFGYSTGQLRNESLMRVLKQLDRAGLAIRTQGDRWGRDDRFRIDTQGDAAAEDVAESLEPEATDEGTPTTTAVELPDPFWPTALGLERSRELEFLRALAGDEPILCLLYMPDQAGSHAWIRAAWEGLVGWAFHAAQRFVWRPVFRDARPDVRVGSETLLGAYVKPSALDEDSFRLLDSPHLLNLVTIKRASEPPPHLHHLTAVWPGPIFEFKPEYSQVVAPSVDMRSLCACLSLAGGVAPVPSETSEGPSPLGMLNWARVAHRQLTAMPITRFGKVLANRLIGRFKGSNECAATLALKAHLAHWIASVRPDANLEFERPALDVEEDDEQMDPEDRRDRRIDLCVEGLGEFEVESLLGSGPMESFYHKKIFSRINVGRDTPFWLVVPNDSVLWAGPHLADLAHHLGAGGHVMVPSLDGGFLEIAGRPLAAAGVGPTRPEEVSAPPEATADAAEARLRLDDVAGYADIRAAIEAHIIWPERHRARLRGLSRSSGILFFGPPGCGKTRWAHAIAGELEQEVRLLGPADLRSQYIGAGQIQIREQFDWLAEGESRMLVIDELDVVAHSRHERQMHTDDKASVNELLIQVDRVLRLGRLLAATTNFIGSLDEALTRSGRFGRFIPVAPPDLDEATAIVAFYLKALAGPPEPDGKVGVHIPETHLVRAILAPLYERDFAEARFFCGADLESAVGSAYMRSVRAATTEDGWADGRLEAVDVSEDALAESLAAAPRSVQPESVEQFLADVDRYCNRDLAAAMARRLKPAPPVSEGNGHVDHPAFLGRIARLIPRPRAGRRREP